MPGSQREVSNAIEEGIEFDWLTLPTRYLGEKKLIYVEAINMQLTSLDKSGRRNPEIKTGSEHNIESDLVIEALGFDPEDVQSMFDEKDLEITKWGTIKINYNNMMTKIEGVFAAGDIVRGGSLVVWGIKDGRDVAANIHNYLQKKDSLIENNQHKVLSNVL